MGKSVHAHSMDYWVPLLAVSRGALPGSPTFYLDPEVLPTGLLKTTVLFHKPRGLTIAIHSSNVGTFHFQVPWCKHSIKLYAFPTPFTTISEKWKGSDTSYLTT